jgi:hypothetical protein
MRLPVLAAVVAALILTAIGAWIGVRTLTLKSASASTDKAARQ